MKRVAVLFWIALASLPVVSGCGGSGGEKTPYKAGGVALFEDNQPVTGLDVMLQPVEGSGQAARGTLDAQGKFQLTTYQKDDGAPAGKYKVYFMASTGAPPDALNPPTASGPPPMPRMPDTVVAKEYLSFTDTPLTVEIKAGDNPEIKLTGVKRAAPGKKP
jgi:hypothetical protein